MARKLISIIIPTFNEERNIGRLLVSIKKQTHKGIETIIVDDGSQDSTVKIARKYSKNVYSRQHAERSIQRNFGAKKAKGDFLLFLDADMELTPEVIKSCLENIKNGGALIIPERTVGEGFVARVRQFERKMYMGDKTVEVARFFPKKIFQEFGGYDENLTGTEDYDLPRRIQRKYEINWANKYILHHETGLTLKKQLQKKFYYAQKSSSYVDKHPDLISKQGILIIRKAYLKNWQEFVKHPILGFSLLLMRFLETLFASLGFLKAVGPIKFFKTILVMIKNI